MLNETIPLNSSRTDLLCKLTIREKLEQDIQEFLEKGGKINEVPFGHREIKDEDTGFKRNGKSVFIESPKANRSPNGDHNEDSVGKLNPDPKTNTKKSEQTKKTAPKISTPKVQKVKVRKSRSKNPKDEAELARYRKVKELHAEAVFKNETRFEAPCKIHGYTTYEICSNGIRCLECRVDAREKRSSSKPGANERKLNLERIARNKQRMNKAIETGLKVFTGECVNCGITDMKIKTKKIHNGENQYSFVCVNCCKASFAKAEEKKKIKKLALKLKKTCEKAI